MTFGDFAEHWLAGLIDDASDRASYQTLPHGADILLPIGVQEVTAVTTSRRFRGLQR